MDNSLTFDALINQILDQILHGEVSEDHFHHWCKNARQTGLPLTRVSLSWGTLHPIIEAMNLTWLSEDDSHTVNHFLHSEDDSEDWLASPLYYCLQNHISLLEADLTDPALSPYFPVYDLFKERGSTQYILSLVPFSPINRAFTHNDGALISWQTNQPGGFTPTERQQLDRLQQHLALAIKMSLRETMTRNTLNTYLGNLAGQRILDGAIKLGDGETINAVIWYTDLRASTSLSENMSDDEFLQTLNDYFYCSAGAVQEQGGEILRFIGDGVLGIFPIIDNGYKKACRQATDAARLMLQKLDETNQQRRQKGRVEIRLGLGLHCGEIMFGNVGIANRMDFAITGPAANQVSRIEESTKNTPYCVFASEQVASHINQEWMRAGDYSLRGSKNQQPLYRLK